MIDPYGELNYSKWLSMTATGVLGEIEKRVISVLDKETTIHVDEEEEAAWVARVVIGVLREVAPEILSSRNTRRARVRRNIRALVRWRGLKRAGLTIWLVYHAEMGIAFQCDDLDVCEEGTATPSLREIIHAIREGEPV